MLNPFLRYQMSQVNFQILTWYSLLKEEVTRYSIPKTNEHRVSVRRKTRLKYTMWLNPYKTLSSVRVPSSNVYKLPSNTTVGCKNKPSKTVTPSLSN